MKAEIADKRSATLKAALELISEQGFHATPMSQIAKRANVSIGIIYHYFSGKDELLNELYIDIKTNLSRNILQNYNAEMPVRKAFKLMMGGLVRYSLQNPSEISFAEQYENSPLITGETKEKIHRMTAPLKELFQRAAEEDLLKDLPYEILYTLIQGALISLVKFYLNGKIPLDEAALDAELDAIWDMIKK
jgi:AcrR family transcriptional regulator